MGGDLQGGHDNANYIGNLGFTAVWISPIVDNLDEAFTGGSRSASAPASAPMGARPATTATGADFFRVDEHLESLGFSFQEFTSKMRTITT